MADFKEVTKQAGIVLWKKYHKCIFTGIADIFVRMISGFLSIADRSGFVEKV